LSVVGSARVLSIVERFPRTSGRPPYGFLPTHRHLSWLVLQVVQRYVIPYVASPSSLLSPPLMVLAELPHAQYAEEELPARWQASLMAVGLGVRAAMPPTRPSYDVHDFLQPSRLSQTASFFIAPHALPASTDQGEEYLYARYALRSFRFSIWGPSSSFTTLDDCTLPFMYPTSCIHMYCIYYSTSYRRDVTPGHNYART
jgi:hypothetical protein